MLTALMVAFAGYYFWQAHTTAELDIRTATAGRGDVRRVVLTSGRVKALGTVEIGSQLSGNVGELYADFSSEVKEGQVLARIEPSTFESKVREKEAGLAIAKADVVLQEATVQRAKASLRKGEIDRRRAEELVRRGVGSQAVLDEAITAHESAIAEVAIAEAQTENAEATVEQSQATLDSALIDLERTYIRSPIDGVVIERSVEAGQTVAASMTAPKLFMIAQDLSQVHIEAQVDEADIGQVTSNSPVTFTVDAYPGLTFQGTVEQIRLAPTALNNVVTYTVVIAADNQLGRLLPGMTANVEMVTGEHKDVVLVPSEALRFKPRGPAQEALVSPKEVDTVVQLASASIREPGLLDLLEQQLELNEMDMSQIRTALDAELDAIRKESATAGSEDDVPEQVNVRFAQVMRSLLTPEIYKKYEEIARLRSSGQRTATLWTYDDGSFWPQEVKLGLSDGNVTEIIEGLTEGAKVVLRVREVSK